MKTKTFVFFITIIFISSSCEKPTLENMDVKTFVKLLKTGDFDFKNSMGLPDLPPFQSTDIPELLKFANEDQIIKKYPQNPISSYIGPDPKLGVFILWTIESIKIADDRPYGRFPTMHPTIRIRFTELAADVNVAHPTVYQAYVDWWNSDTDFEQIRDIDPLENTDFAWW